MARLGWDLPGSKRYEYGTDRGVFYPRRSMGVIWPGLVSIEENYSVDQSAGYLDGVVFGQFQTSELFSATITSFGRPLGFDAAEGFRRAASFLSIGQQPREPFGMSYRTRVGDDVHGMDALYKLHLVYNATIDSSPQQFVTLSDDEESTPVVFEIRCVPEQGISGPSKAHVEVLSTEIGIGSLETILYGSANDNPRLPGIDELYEILGWSHD